MDTLYIETLLEKFWNAETTDQEEATLKEYFNQDAVDPIFDYAKPFFVVMDESAEIVPDLTASVMHKLLEKYYQAETTLEEESILKSYFAQESISEELKPHAPIFRSFEMVAHVEMKKGLSIDHLKTKPTRIISLTWVKVAAAAVFFVVGGYFVMQQANQPEVKTMAKARYIEPDNPEEALEYTLKALAMVSRKYKKGEAQLLEGMRTINEAKGAGN